MADLCTSPHITAFQLLLFSRVGGIASGPLSDLAAGSFGVGISPVNRAPGSDRSHRVQTDLPAKRLGLSSTSGTLMSALRPLIADRRLCRARPPRQMTPS